MRAEVAEVKGARRNKLFPVRINEIKGLDGVDVSENAPGICYFFMGMESSGVLSLWIGQQVFITKLQANDAHTKLVEDDYV